MNKGTPAKLGTFDIRRRLGSGGMAEVFVAEKYGAAMGKMGAVSLILGTGLHGAGAALGKKATFGAGLAPNSITKAETEALGIERAATQRVEDAVDRSFRPTVDVNAGLAPEAGAVERPISIDPTKRYRVGLDTEPVTGRGRHHELQGSRRDLRGRLRHPRGWQAVQLRGGSGSWREL